jgi:hypothetical protein
MFERYVNKKTPPSFLSVSLSKIILIKLYLKMISQHSGFHFCMLLEACMDLPLALHHIRFFTSPVVKVFEILPRRSGRAIRTEYWIIAKYLPSQESD